MLSRRIMLGVKREKVRILGFLRWWLCENEGMSEVIQRSMYCTGCRGDRSVHWSPDCWILKCCVDKKGLDFCHECDVFPCKQLDEWSMENKQYAQALERLQRMREKIHIRD